MQFSRIDKCQRPWAMFLLFCSLAVFTSIASAGAGEKVISKQRATAIAEKFVVDNGYTNAAPDRAAFKKEGLERTADMDKILESRRDTLKAASIGAKSYADGWYVVFEYKKESERNKKVGRAVAIDKHGRIIKMCHQDFKLSALKK